MSNKQNRPCVQEEQPGRKAWCSCGDSAKQPFCDGAHRTNGSGKTPVVVELKDAQKVAWCMCKLSKNPPYCDGSHRTLPPDWKP